MARGQFSQVLRHIRQWMGAGDAAAAGTDSQLLERFVTHQDPAAFAALVQRHGGLIWGVCRRVLRDGHAAEEAFQATVVILSRRAASIGKRDALPSWLYGVAYRVAVRARSNARKRQEREQGINDMRPADTQVDPSRTVDPAATAAWREAQAVLDEELQRLPEKHRAPLVLCYLDGKTHEEAAGVLNCPVGSMSWRLAQARERLRAGLARRGIALSSLALTAFLSDSAAARAPAPLLQLSIQAALGGAAGAAGLSAEAASLVEGVSRMLWATQLKKAAVAAAVVVGLLGTGLGVLTYRSMGKDADNAKPGAAPTKKEELPAGPVVNGLKLSLHADKSETVMNAGGDDAEPVPLKLTFTNVSTKPIKFSIYQFAGDLIRGTVKTPGADSVKVERVSAAVRPVPPTAADYLEIKPGQSWSYQGDLAFPGWIPEGSYTSAQYMVRKPGVFTLQFTYKAAAFDAPPAKDAWVGELVSNALAITVKPAGQKNADGAAVQGLKLTLSADKTETVIANGVVEPIKLTRTFTNVSDQPIRLDTYVLDWYRVTYQVTGPDADSVRAMQNLVDILVTPPDAQSYPVLKPGESYRYTFQPPFPNVEGPMLYTLLKPGVYRIKTIYTNEKAAANEFAGGSWTGTLPSNEIVLKVKPR